MHAAKTSHIKAIIVGLIVNQKFRRFVTTACDPNIVFSSREIKFCETSINYSKLSLAVIDHHIVRFYITMHDALVVAKI